MSDNILYRSTELRAADDGRNVYGCCVPYGVETEIQELGRRYTERFAPGAFSRSIRERGSKVRLLVSHNTRTLPIGKATELYEQPDGLRASFAIAATRDGDDALELVRSGTVDSFSVGFRPIRDRQENGVTVRVEAALYEVSLVGFPAYPGALVGGVRSADRPAVSVDVMARRLDLVLAQAWPDLASIRAASKEDAKGPHGDVVYADPGYQEDGKKRYPLDTEKHVRAAWSYINQAKNQKPYTPEQLAKIKSKIKAAARKLGIDISDD